MGSELFSFDPAVYFRRMIMNGGDWARPFKEVQDTVLWRFLLKMLSLHQFLEVPIVKKLETRFGKVHGIQLRLF